MHSLCWQHELISQKSFSETNLLWLKSPNIWFTKNATDFLKLFSTYKSKTAQSHSLNSRLRKEKLRKTKIMIKDFSLKIDFPHLWKVFHMIGEASHNFHHLNANRLATEQNLRLLKPFESFGHWAKFATGQTTIIC